MIRSLGRIAVLFALVVVARPARAQDAQGSREGDAQAQADLDQAKAHYAIALKAFDAGDYLLAISELKRAYFLSHRTAILLNLGRTYAKMGDRANAVRVYRQYLAESSADASGRAEASRAIEELLSPTPHPSFDEEVDRQREQYEGPDSFSHQAIDSAPPGVPLDVVVRGPVNPKSRKLRVIVYYRAPGQADYTAVVAERFLEERVARVPESAMMHSALQYYIVAQSPGGGTMYLSATAAAPNVVVVDPSAKRQRSIAMEVWIRTQQENATPARTSPQPIRGSWRARLDLAEKHRRQRYSAGLGLVVGGGVLAVVSAAVGFGLATAYSSAVAGDSRSRPRLVFDESNVSDNDRSYADAGARADTAGIVGTAIGAAAAVAGAVLMITARKPQTLALVPRVALTGGGLTLELHY